MTSVMMMLGAYPFMIDTAAYQALRRVSNYSWRQQDRLGQRPSQQYLGPGSDEISLRGEIMPFWKGGTGQIDLMRAQAELGEPLILLEGNGGFVMGDWVIMRIEETRTELLADGRPRVIEFSITLRQYGEDRGAVEQFALGARAVRTLADLL